MCLILFAYRAHPRYQLILAANRDEFYQRPTAALHHWQDHPEILAGRDLSQMGTWMGITRTGRFAAITNYRSKLENRDSAPSRGHLVSAFLTANHAPDQYLLSVESVGDQYNGFNLIVGDPDAVWYYSNRNGRPASLEPGIHGLSNHFLNTDWPKVRQGKQALAELLDEHRRLDPEHLMTILQNQRVQADEDLPDTGVGLQWERTLAPIFITSPSYGTRSSSVLLIDRDGCITFCERTWRPEQSIPSELHTRLFEFKARV